MTEFRIKIIHDFQVAVRFEERTCRQKCFTATKNYFVMASLGLLGSAYLSPRHLLTYLLTYLNFLRPEVQGLTTFHPNENFACMQILLRLGHLILYNT